MGDVGCETCLFAATHTASILHPHTPTLLLLSAQFSPPQVSHDGWRRNALDAFMWRHFVLSPASIQDERYHTLIFSAFSHQAKASTIRVF